MSSSRVFRNSIFKLLLNLATGTIFCNCFTSDRRREKEEEEEDKHPDRLSDLPDDILHLILSFLPLKSVAQATVLSRRWRYLRCSTYPFIDFYEVFTSDEAVLHQLKARIIETVFSGRDEKFNMKVSRNPRDSYLPRAEEELVVELSFGSNKNRDDLARCKLKRDSLRIFESKHRRCGLGFPSSYAVESFFRSLHTLCLKHLDFLDKAFGVELFSGSNSFPCLKKLKIVNCRGISDLKIRRPDLKYLDVSEMDLDSLEISGMKLEKLIVSGVFKSCVNTDGICVNIFAPNLQFFYWSTFAFLGKCSIQSFPKLKRSFLDGWVVIRESKTICDNGIVLLASSSQAEYLNLGDDFLQILSEIYFEFSGYLPFSFMKLKKLSIDLSLGKQQFPGVACLLKSSPVVHELTISFQFFEIIQDIEERNSTLLDDVKGSTEEQFWETQAQYMSPLLSHLEVVNFELGKTINGIESAVSFVKFLLKYGKALQEIMIRYGPPNSLNDIVRLLEESPRASADVKFST